MVIAYADCKKKNIILIILTPNEIKYLNTYKWSHYNLQSFEVYDLKPANLYYIKYETRA